MTGSLLIRLLGCVGIVTIFVGLWSVVQLVANVQATYGQTWGAAVFGAGLFAIGAVASACWWYQDFLLGFAGAFFRRVPLEKVYCQTCGEPAKIDAPACSKCGGVQFAFTPPGAVTDKWHVQIGMDVLSSEGDVIGAVRERRHDDFLVARPRRRDVYVPYKVVSSGTRSALTLSIDSDDLDTRDWPHPGLLSHMRS